MDGCGSLQGFSGGRRSFMDGHCRWFDDGYGWVWVRDFTGWCWLAVNCLMVLVGDLESLLEF